jgi:spore coat polysaccharide biosynthesis protein SpsF
MKTAAIIQARMGSTRLPGKVLMDICGKTVLERVVRRVRHAQTVEEVVVATTTSAQDDAIADACARLDVSCFRGPEYDVLDRYLRAAEEFEADVIVRITSDCPLIDPQLIDQVVARLFELRADFACNVLPRTYPRGLDVEVFTREALRKAWELSTQPHQREHVTPLFYERRDLFNFAAVLGEPDYSRHRWTLDTREDFRLITAIYEYFEGREEFGWRQAVTLMERLPELAAINAHVRQKEVSAC